MKSGLARREFLRIFSMGLGAYTLQTMFLDNLMGQILNSAFAATGNEKTNPNKMFYVHLTMFGAPPRWYFDLPLTPMGMTAKNFKAGSFGTTLENASGLAKAIYRADKVTAAGKSYSLPPVWNMSLARHSFSDLLQNTAMIRGVDMEINNHSLSNRRQVAPVIGGYSISGMNADASGTPLPAIQDASGPASLAFRSLKGLSGTNIDYTENANRNPVLTALAPFAEYRKGRAVHSASNDALSDQIHNHFENYRKQKGLTQSALTQMYDAAMDLVEKNVTRLASDWDATVARYRAVITEAIHPKKGSLSGVFDTKIPGDSVDHPALRAEDGNIKLGDLRDIITERTRIPQLAENFAAAEILLGDLTATATLNMNSLRGLYDGVADFNATHDQHQTGSAAGVIINTLFYRAVLGCLSEFKSALVRKKIFDRTLIHIGSEFNRTPRALDGGSDHGFMGSSVTLISGMIRKPTVFGNIQVADYNNTYQGTFGVAADFKLPSGEVRPLRINDVSRTITGMLGLQDVTTNGEPLMKSDSGLIWVPRNEEMKNV